MGRDDLPVVSGATIKSIIWVFQYQLGDTNLQGPCLSDCFALGVVQRNAGNISRETARSSPPLPFSSSELGRDVSSRSTLRGKGSCRLSPASAVLLHNGCDGENPGEAWISTSSDNPASSSRGFARRRPREFPILQFFRPHNSSTPQW